MKRIALNLVIASLTAAASAQPQTPPPAVPAPSTQAAPASPAAPAAKARVRVAPRPAMAFAWAGDESGSYLGVDIGEITPDRVKALKLKEERGVEITMVDQDAPAAKAGVKEHDVVTEFNGQRVEGSEQFVRYIHETPAGRTVTLGIVRDGQPMTLKATLGNRMEKIKKQYSYKMAPMPRVVVPQPMIPDFDVEVPAIDVMTPSTSTGIAIDNLTPQLAQYFGVKQGVLVRNVEKGSAAEKAGMKAGDVIVKVDNEAIESRSDYRQAIRHRNADTVKIVVMRDKKEQTLTMSLPKPKRDRDDDDSSFLSPDFDFQFDNNSWDDEAMENAFSHMQTAFQNMPKIDGAEINQHVRDAMRHLPLVTDGDCDLK